MRHLLVLGALVLLGGVADAAPHGARLTYFDDPTTSIAISWNSDVATDDKVTYGTSMTSLTQMATGTKIVQAAPLSNSFTAKLTGLEPGTTYYYRIGDHPAASEAPFSFTTLASDPCEPFRYIVIGDNRQDLGDGSNPVWAQILAETLPFAPAFYVNTGDMVLDGNTPTQWNNFIDASESGWANVPSILTMGNHDDSDPNGDGATYNQLYELPRNGDGVEDYYSIDVGPIHFATLNSQYNDPNATDYQKMIDWLDADLTATQQPWKIVVFHKAVYTRGNHHTGEENAGAINKGFIPIFDKHHVDLVLNGHSHNYERYAPSKGVDTLFDAASAGRMLPAGPGAMLGEMVPDGATGTTYLVTGGAGALTTDILGFTCLDASCTLCTGFNVSCDANVFAKDKEANVIYEGRHNFVVVDVVGDTMTFEARTTTAGNIDGQNQVIEKFTMKKSSFNLQCGSGGPPDAGPVVGVPDAAVSGGGDGGQGLSGDKGGGCGCRAAGREPTNVKIVIWLALTMCVVRRRRRA